MTLLQALNQIIAEQGYGIVASHVERSIGDRTSRAFELETLYQPMVVVGAATEKEWARQRTRLKELLGQELEFPDYTFDYYWKVTTD